MDLAVLVSQLFQETQEKKKAESDAKRNKAERGAKKEKSESDEKKKS